MFNRQQLKRPCGFTMMETLLAVALIGMLISVFITVFVPARDMMSQALSKQDSDRLVSILRSEMNTLRPNERNASDPSGAFGKGFRWLQSCRNPHSAIVIFSYRADTARPKREDGTYPAIPTNSVKPGRDTQLVTVACPMNSNIHKDDIRYAVGPVYLVKLTQLLPDGDGRYRISNTPGTISGASTADTYFSQDKDDPWGGVIFCRADFYLMRPANPARYKGRRWTRVGRPLFSSNLSFRR